MPRPDFPFDINPAVLRWARESAGQSAAAVAERLKVSPQTVAEWETGRRAPQWKSLRKLAREYQRPLAALLLPSPPEEPDLPPDYRTLPRVRRELSSQTRLAIRTARWLQERAVELHEQLERETHFTADRARLSQKPETLATTWRNALGVGIEEQKSWSHHYEAYRRWRAALEEQGVLVFQFRMPVDELRGFSLFHQTVPVIATSELDLVQARVFTLFHEFAHLLLQQPGLCVPSEASLAGDASVETFCNRFSAAFLIPDSEIGAWTADAGELSGADAGRSLKQLARLYHVSKYVVLGRMRARDRISETAYRRIAGQWRSQDESRSPTARKRTGGGASAVDVCRRQRGGALVSLVLEAERKGVITTHDAVTYLGVKTKDLAKLESRRA